MNKNLDIIPETCRDINNAYLLTAHTNSKVKKGMAVDFLVDGKKFSGKIIEKLGKGIKIRLSKKFSRINGQTDNN